MSLNRIKQLELKNFRNIFSGRIFFSKKINCIFGCNGNGKTNILEAIYILANRKSFRKNASFPQLLSIDGDNSKIYITAKIIDNSDNESIYSSCIEENNSEWFLDGQKIKKKDIFKSVMVNPFDAVNFHNIPQFKRWWFDHHLSDINKEYHHHYVRYNKLLKQRNFLLKNRPVKFLEQVNAIDFEFAKSSYFLTKERLNFLNELNPIYKKIFKEIFDIKHSLCITLEAKVNQFSEENYRKILKERLDLDTRAQTTTYGIHKDNFRPEFDGFLAQDYASLGQQKSSYFALLFAYIELFRYKYNAYPVVLIDDVSGELDRPRWKGLIEYIKGKDFQVIISTASEEFKDELKTNFDVNLLEVNSGIIKQI